MCSVMWAKFGKSRSAVPGASGKRLSAAAVCRGALGCLLTFSLLETELVRRGLTPNGTYRSLGYNSPMVPVEQRYWEVQVPIAD